MQIDAQWQALSLHAARLIDSRIIDLVAADPGRAHASSLRVGSIYANFSRQRLDADALAALLDMARAAGVPGRLRSLFDGAPVNASEARPALHTALRSKLSGSATAGAARAQALEVQARMRAMVSALESSRVSDVINVGIGGSDLGPRLAVDALRDFSTGRFKVHFLNNADAGATSHLMRRLDPASTAVVLVSKSFSTEETLLNGRLLRDWQGESPNLHAVTANPGRAAEFGVPAERILPMWDWVGGRYSLWSAVGFAVALSVGFDRFQQLLDGAALMDAHVIGEPVESNLAVLHALMAVWNRNALGLDTQAILPYDDRLALLPSYLQQLVMESLGKSVRLDGSPVSVATSPVIWGGPGTSSQHSFFQSLHQGTDTVPADLIGIARPAHGFRSSQDVLISHLLAQGEALANGAADADPQKAYPGNRPSTFLMLDTLDPRSLGALLAMYEHSVYVQSVIWGINAFDQWGVELGKRIASSLLPAVASGDAMLATDPVTRELLAEINRQR